MLPTTSLIKLPKRMPRLEDLYLSLPWEAVGPFVRVAWNYIEPDLNHFQVLKVEVMDEAANAAIAAHICNAHNELFD